MRRSERYDSEQAGAQRRAGEAQQGKGWKEQRDGVWPTGRVIRRHLDPSKD